MYISKSVNGPHVAHEPQRKNRVRTIRLVLITPGHSKQVGPNVWDLPEHHRIICARLRNIRSYPRFGGPSCDSGVCSRPAARGRNGEALGFSSSGFTRPREGNPRPRS